MYAATVAKAMLGFAGHASADEAGAAIAYVWADILESAHLAIVAGPIGVGKTTLAILLIVALANPTGSPVEVLGHLVTPVPDGQMVVFVEEENSARSVARKLRDACQMLGLPERETLDRVVTFCRCGARLAAETTDGAVFMEILKAAKADLVGAVIVDSWATCVTGDSNSEEDQALGAKCLRKLVTESGSPVVVLAHTRKGTADSLDDVAGSHQRAAAADVVLLVNAERQDGRVLSSKVVFAKLRDCVDEYPAPATFSIAKDEAGAWRVATNASARPDDRPAHERVHAFLERRGMSTKTEMREALTMSSTTLEQALSVLFSERRIRKEAKRNSRGKVLDAFEAKTKPKDLFEELAQPQRKLPLEGGKT
jgi:hypothetical protein